MPIEQKNNHTDMTDSTENEKTVTARESPTQ